MISKPTTNFLKCRKCGNCFINCPNNAIIRDEEGYFTPDCLKCRACGKCVKECPYNAIKFSSEQ